MRMRIFSRLNFFLLAAWLLLSAMGVWLYREASRVELRPGWESPAMIKKTSNLMQVAALPGVAVGRILHVKRPWMEHALSWALWLALLRGLLSLRGAVRVMPTEGTFNPGRRRLLVDGVLAGGAMTGGVAGVGATLVEPWHLQLRRYSVELDDLPVPLSGMRLVLLTDLHLGARIPASFIREAVTRTLALRPDLVLLGGDYVHSREAEGAAVAALLAPLIGERIPTAGVLGNHDWYADGPAISKALREVGVAMVDNGRVLFASADRRLRPLSESDGPDDGLLVAGVGDLEMDVVDVRRALRDVPAGMPRLLLSHEPDVAELKLLIGERVDLMLSGHTHGGQVRLPLLGTPVVPSRFGSKYAGGFVQGPLCRVLISRGIGMSVLPVRWGVPPEIVEVELLRRAGQE
jgi:predicted MPP superfamily phosphohydrolase